MSTVRQVIKWTSISVCGLLALILCVRLYGNYQIERASHPHYFATGCPLLIRFFPMSKGSIASTDYVELYDWNQGFGQTPHFYLPFHVRVWGDGHIDREIIPGRKGKCSLDPALTVIHVDSDRAKQLIASTRDEGFCQLCQNYGNTGMASDGGSSATALSIGGRTWNVFNRAGKPPHMLNDVNGSIAMLANPDDFNDVVDWNEDRLDACLGH